MKNYVSIFDSNKFHFVYFIFIFNLDFIFLNLENIIYKIENNLKYLKIHLN